MHEAPECIVAPQYHEPGLANRPPKDDLDFFWVGAYEVKPETVNPKR